MSPLHVDGGRRGGVSRAVVSDDSILKDQKLPRFFVVRLTELARLGWDAEWILRSLKEMYPQMRRTMNVDFIIAIGKEFGVSIAVFPPGSIAHRDYRAKKSNGEVKATVDCRTGLPRVKSPDEAWDHYLFGKGSSPPAESPVEPSQASGASSLPKPPRKMAVVYKRRAQKALS